MSEALGGFSEKTFLGIRDVDERISVEEIDLLEKKQVMKELLKERRSTEAEERRDTVVAGREVTWMAAAPMRRVISSCLRWEFIRKTRRRVRNPVAKPRRHRRKEEQ